jgi:hypothetical protein
MAGASGVEARFREEKQLALLSEPIESRGTLYFVPPNRLSRETREPSASRLVIDGDRVSFRDAAGGQTVDLSASPIAREYVANFVVLFGGDLDALRKRYEPHFRADANGWTLELVPRAARLREFITRVTLSGRGRALERMEMIEGRWRPHHHLVRSGAHRPRVQRRRARADLLGACRAREMSDRSIRWLFLSALAALAAWSVANVDLSTTSAASCPARTTPSWPRLRRDSRTASSRAR